MGGILFSADLSVLHSYPQGKDGTEYAVPAGVKTIYGYAFSGSDFLKKITIPEGVTTIGGHAFFGCSFLTEITIPASVTSIGQYPFDLCHDLTDIYYGGTAEEWEKLAAGIEMEEEVTVHFSSDM